MNGEATGELRILLSRVVLTDLSDVEEMALVARINQLSPDPEWTDYIFYSDEFFDSHGNLDVDRLISRMAAYRPITL